MVLSSLSVFCKVVELASFRQAADALGVPVATASHQIQALEKRLGIKLLTRTTRRVDVTQEGQLYYQRIAPLLVGIHEAEQLLLSTSHEPKGQLNISAPASIVRTLIAPRLREFTDAHPALLLRFVATDMVVNLSEEGLDCVIRAGPPNAEGLAVRALGSLPQWFAASPCLVERFGFPETPGELAKFPFINYAARRKVDIVNVDAYSGKKHEQFVAAAQVSVNDGDAYVAMALQGLGAVWSPPHDLATHLRSGALRIVLPEWTAPPIPVYAIYARGRQLLPRVRVFVDWMEQQFKRAHLDAASLFVR